MQSRRLCGPREYTIKSTLLRHTRHEGTTIYLLLFVMRRICVCLLLALCCCAARACTIDADCDDANSCTTDTCSGAVCVNTARLNGVACSDAACAINGCRACVCANATCTAAPFMAVCPVVGPCANAVCNLTTGACSIVPLAPGTTCRLATNECDTAEVCDGVSDLCPVDAAVADGTPCTSDGLTCTVDVCTGGTCTHPNAPNTTLCRAAADVCDAAEYCTGASSTCPADAFRDSATVCRAATDTCDVAELCTGNTTACPANVFAAPGTVCAAAADQCHQASVCGGTNATCPPLQALPNRTECETDDCPAYAQCMGGECECVCSLTCVHNFGYWRHTTLPAALADYRLCNRSCTELLSINAARGSDWVKLAQSVCALVADEEATGCRLPPDDRCAQWYAESEIALQSDQWCSPGTGNNTTRFLNIQMNACTHGQYREHRGLPRCEP